jgi:hypothetical protein
MKRILLLTSIVVLGLSSFGQIRRPDLSDTAFFSFDSAIVANKKYIGFLTRDTFYLINSRGDILVKQQGYYTTWEFKDLNGDGHKDLILYHSSNASYVLDLFQFSPTANRFKKIQDFDKFPAPEKIKGTKYYYSYHKSGCADMNWDSDLFYIQNHRAIRIGNISGRQCHNRDDIKDAVYIYKIHGARKNLLKVLPINIIFKYKNFKWGFIQKYWDKNYIRFL